MRKFSLLTSLVLCASAFLISCEKDDASKAQARILVANFTITPPASAVLPPTMGPAIDVRWDGQFLIPNIIYGAPGVNTGSPFTALGNSTTPQSLFAGTYSAIKPGSFNFNLSNTGLGGAAGLTIYDRVRGFLPGKSYTAVAFNFVPFYAVHIMEDDLSAPAAGKIKIRFLHTVPSDIFAAIPGTRRDTIDVTGFGGSVSNPLNNVALFQTRNFGDAYHRNNLTNFISVDSGSYRFGLRVAGTPGTSAATGSLGLFPASGNPIRLLEGKIYTIVARLHPTPATSAVQLGQPAVTIIQHN
jgi:hypothetical protein